MNIPPHELDAMLAENLLLRGALRTLVVAVGALALAEITEVAVRQDLESAYRAAGRISAKYPPRGGAGR